MNYAYCKSNIYEEIEIKTITNIIYNEFCEKKLMDAFYKVNEKTNYFLQSPPKKRD